MSLDNKVVILKKKARQPHCWDRSDVHKWLQWCCNEYSAPDIQQDRFNMNGKALCMLTKEDFCQRVPGLGDVLYNTLRGLVNQPLQGIGYPVPTSPSRVCSPPLMSTPPGAPSLGHIISPQVTPGFPGVDLNFPQTRGAFTPIPIGLPAMPIPQFHQVAALQPVFHPQPRRLLPKPGPLNVPLPVQSPKAPQPDPDPDQPLDMTVQRQGSCLSPLTPPPSEEQDNPEPDPCNPPITDCQSPTGDSSSVSGESASSGPDSEPEAPPSGDNSTPMPGLPDPSKLLWEFIDHLLVKSPCPDVVRWEDRDQLVFRIVSPSRLAALWGMQKHKKGMTYEKLSRALRYYYKMNIISKVLGKRLTYRFLRPPNQIQKGQRGAKRGVPHRPRGSRLRGANTVATSAHTVASVTTDTNQDHLHNQINQDLDMDQTPEGPSENPTYPGHSLLPHEKHLSLAMTGDTSLVCNHSDSDQMLCDSVMSPLASRTPVLARHLAITPKAIDHMVSPLVTHQVAIPFENQQRAPLPEHQQSHLVAPHFMNGGSTYQGTDSLLPSKPKLPILEFLSKCTSNSDITDENSAHSSENDVFDSVKIEQKDSSFGPCLYNMDTKTEMECRNMSMNKLETFSSKQESKNNSEWTPDLKDFNPNPDT